MDEFEALLESKKGVAPARASAQSSALNTPERTAPTIWSETKPLIIPNGIGLHAGVSSDVYHSQQGSSVPRLSYSVAKTMIHQSPLHAWLGHPKLGGCSREATDEMEAGNIAHMLLIGKGAELAVGEFDTWQSKKAREFRDDARAAGRIPVKAHKLEAIETMVDAVSARIKDTDAADFFDDDAEPEVAAIWNAHTDDGELVECQSMFDKLRRSAGRIFDIKFTTSAHDRKVSALIANMGYDIQEAFYTPAFESLHPELAGRVSFTFIFIETAPPYAVLPVKLDGEYRAIGRSKAQRAINQWAECLRTGYWPAYSKYTISMSPPPWALAAEMTESDY